MWTNVMHGWLQLSRNSFSNTKRNSLFTNTLDRPNNLILLFLVQADILTLLPPLLLLGVDRLRGVGLHLAGVQAQVVERESLHHGAKTIGLTQSLLAEGAKVGHVMTNLIRVHIQLVGLIHLLRGNQRKDDYSELHLWRCMQVSTCQAAQKGCCSSQSRCFTC